MEAAQALTSAEGYDGELLFVPYDIASVERAAAAPAMAPEPVATQEAPEEWRKQLDHCPAQPPEMFVLEGLFSAEQSFATCPWQWSRSGNGCLQNTSGAAAEGSKKQAAQENTSVQCDSVTEERQLTSGSEPVSKPVEEPGSPVKPHSRKRRHSSHEDPQELGCAACKRGCFPEKDTRVRSV